MASASSRNLLRRRHTAPLLAGSGKNGPYTVTFSLSSFDSSFVSRSGDRPPQDRNQPSDLKCLTRSGFSGRSC
jgi:hypothetical protein